LYLARPKSPPRLNVLISGANQPPDACNVPYAAACLGFLLFGGAGPHANDVCISTPFGLLRLSLLPSLAPENLKSAALLGRMAAPTAHRPACRPASRSGAQRGRDPKAAPSSVLRRVTGRDATCGRGFSRACHFASVCPFIEAVPFSRGRANDPGSRPRSIFCPRKRLGRFPALFPPPSRRIGPCAARKRKCGPSERTGTASAQRFHWKPRPVCFVLNKWDRSRQWASPELMDTGYADFRSAVSSFRSRIQLLLRLPARSIGLSCRTDRMSA
jgi:hypothetical protein